MSSSRRISEWLWIRWGHGHQTRDPREASAVLFPGRCFPYWIAKQFIGDKYSLPLNKVSCLSHHETLFVIRRKQTEFLGCWHKLCFALAPYKADLLIKYSGYGSLNQYSSLVWIAGKDTPWTKAYRHWRWGGIWKNSHLWWTAHDVPFPFTFVLLFHRGADCI